MNCYLCGSQKLDLIRTHLRHDIERKVFKCGECGLVYLEPKEQDLRNYYGNEYRKTYSPLVDKALSSEEVFKIALPGIESRLARFKDLLKPEMKVLDIGCSSGHLMYAMKNYVSECVGIEYNNEDAEYVRNNLGFKVYQTPIEETDLPI